MALRSDRHLATLCSATALLLRGRLVDKAPGARGSSSRLGRFNLTPIVEAEYMAATGFPTQNLKQVLASWLGPYMAERTGFEPAVPPFWPERAASGIFAYLWCRPD
jgi:hypothetical protein